MSENHPLLETSSVTSVCAALVSAAPAPIITAKNGLADTGTRTRGLLSGAAQTIAASVVNGEALSGGEMCLRQLRDALLAESADASDAAALRCASLRKGLATAVRTALSARPCASHLLYLKAPAPMVRIEVRQTAGRCIAQEAFTVGRAPECDVQITGDCTVSRLQLVVIPLPGCVLVVDAWSSGGSRVVKRSGSTGHLPASIPPERRALVFPHGERVIVLIGARTTISLGPSAEQALKARAALAPVQVQTQQQCLQEIPARIPSETAANGAKVAAVNDVVATSVWSNARGHAAAGAGVAGAHGHERRPAQDMWKRCRAIVQASVRLHRAAVLRDRLRSRCRWARDANVIPDDLCAELEERLRTQRGHSMDDVKDVLDGLGVPPMLRSRTFSTESSPWTCMICRDPQHTTGWRCPFGHRFCCHCMAHWAEAQAMPKCPSEGCSYYLAEHDLQSLRVNRERLEALQVERLEQGLQALQEDAASPVEIFRCPGVGCAAAVVLGSGETRTRYVCSCGAPPVCTGCGAVPYHYHGECALVQPLRARWLAWLQGGREAYKGLQRRAAREATAQQRALREASDRHSELERDELWKAEHCRLCPNCRRVVEKLDGCNTIVCGQNTHGGNRQPGCGQRFSWKEAKPYRPKVRPMRIPSLTPLVARKGAISGRGVRHLFAQCGLCGDDAVCIVGPRFRCIHCPSFSCCIKCEKRLETEHENGHVFQIMFEDDLDWSRLGVVLPEGTRARIRARGLDSAVAAEGIASDNRKRLRCKQSDAAGLEGIVRGEKQGRYQLELSGGGGNRYVDLKNLQPLLTQRQAERLLASIPATQEEG